MHRAQQPIERAPGIVLYVAEAWAQLLEVKTKPWGAMSYSLTFTSGVPWCTTRLLRRTGLQVRFFRVFRLLGATLGLNSERQRTLKTQLRMSGYSVVRLHTDTPQGRSTRQLQGYPRSASCSGGQVPNLMIKLLSSGLSHDAWPQVCRYVHELERRRSERNERPCPFGAEVLVKQMKKRQDLQPNHESW